MQNASRFARVALLAAAAAVALAVPAAADAAKVDVRVQTPKKALSDASFNTGTVSIRTDRRRPACGGTGERKSIGGATALGALVDASRNAGGLRPVGVTDRFDFGLLVCGIGRSLGSDSGFWLYKVNHRSPEVGADQRRIKAGDEVLWYYSDAKRKVNTGAELAIIAPARAASGKRFTIRVVAYDARGRRTPARNATVRLGKRTAQTDSRGRVAVTLRGQGNSRLTASRGADIPAAAASVCFAERLSRCPATRGRRIFGGSRDETLRGTRGSDVIRAGAGNDQILAADGVRDVIRCGPGRDTARVDAKDVVTGCEQVKRRRSR